MSGVAHWSGATPTEGPATPIGDLLAGHHICAFAALVDAQNDPTVAGRKKLRGPLVRRANRSPEQAPFQETEALEESLIRKILIFELLYYDWTSPTEGL